MGALIFLTLKKGYDLFAVEVYLMFLFFVCGQGLLTLEGPLASYYLRVLQLVFHCYNSWFVFGGIDKLGPDPASRLGCCLIFFFGKVNLFGWYRTMTVPLSFFFFYFEIRSAMEDVWEDMHMRVKCVISVLYHILFILSVELTIKWSNMEGVQNVWSVGQVIALIIGIGNMVYTFVRLIQTGPLWVLRMLSRGDGSTEEVGLVLEEGQGQV